MINWLLRFLKGIFIGSGFILPGVSGGALAAVFGVYEKIIGFLANLRRDTLKNFIYLIPIGLGGLAGVFIFSYAVSYLLGNFEAQIRWFFVGCIIGVLPTLWKQAGKVTRQKKHIVTLIIVFVLGLIFMLSGESLFSAIPQNFFTWILAGALIALGIIVPGLSTSNFILYMGMYKAMADGIVELNPMVIIPIIIGAIVTMLAFSKLMDYIFQKAHTMLFHCILGIVLASTVMIVPRDFNYLSIGILPCILLCAAGILVGWWMCTLEKKYKQS